MVVEVVIKVVMEYGFKIVDVIVKGFGFGCEVVICLL